MKTILSAVQQKQSLTRKEAERLLNELIDGQLSPAEIGEVLLCLRAKEETTAELLGFIDGLTKKAHRFTYPGDLLDVCGTGGDGAQTFNVSTGVAFVLASAGVKVAKHGNRGVSSSSGSSDVLEALGIKSDLNAESATRSLNEHDLSFLFAPAFHPSFAKLGPIRKSLGVYTIFNALGPILNPAPITHQLMGVYDERLLPKVASVLHEKGVREAFVVHGSDGLDEFTLSGPSSVAKMSRGVVTGLTLTPEDFGLNRASIEAVKGGTSKVNAEILLQIFRGEKSQKRDLILMNASAALVLSGKESNFKNATVRAAQLIDSGATLKLLEQMQKTGAPS